MQPNIESLEEKAYQIRRLCVEMITYDQWGHIGDAFSLAEIMAALYFHRLRIDPANPHWETGTASSFPNPRIACPLRSPGPPAVLPGGGPLHVLRARRA